MFRVFLSSNLVCFILILSLSAWAGSGSKAHQKLGAKSLINEGNSKFEAQEYQSALDLYLAAYELYPSPKIAYNIARTAEYVGKLILAERNYEIFLSDPKFAQANTPLVREVKNALKQIKNKFSFLVITGSPSSARINVDGEDKGELSERPIRIKAGKRQIILKHEDYASLMKEVEAIGGQTISFSVNLVPLPQTAALASGPGAPFYKRIWFWGVVGAVVVAGATGGILAASGSEDPIESELGSFDWSTWDATP